MSESNIQVMVGVNGVALTELAIHFNDSDFEIPGLDIIAGIEEAVSELSIFIYGSLKKEVVKEACFRSRSEPVLVTNVCF